MSTVSSSSRRSGFLTPQYGSRVKDTSEEAGLLHERRSTEQAIGSLAPNVWQERDATDATAWYTPIVEGPPLTVEEIKMRESRAHVDQVYDMVPFWIKNIEAAERGEMLKFETFLESLESDPWASRGPDYLWMQDDPDQWPTKDVWAAGSHEYQGWAEDDASNNGWGDTRGWDLDANLVPSYHKEATGNKDATKEMQPQQKPHIKAQRSTKPTINWISASEDPHDFVEKFARHEGADKEKTQRMHAFFDMPTNEKVKKINAAIHSLQALGCE